MRGWYSGAADGNTDWLILCKKCFGDVYPLPIEMCIPFDPVILYLGIYPNEIIRKLVKDEFTRRLIASFSNSKKHLEATVGKIVK